MDETITLTIPSAWLKDIDFDQTILRQALQLGLRNEDCIKAKS